MAAAERPDGKANSVMGYFRKLFEDRPDLLSMRYNDEVIERWLIDHPDHDEMPRSVRSTLANLKCMLRKKSPLENHNGKMRSSGNGLEHLENLIDEALVYAKSVDPIALHDVIHLLRRARNAVVLRLAGR